MTPDVNVLVAASRTDQPHHAAARARLEDAVTASGAGAAFTLMPMVLASFLRLVTSPKIFQPSTPIKDAVAFVDALLASPGFQLAPLGREWSKLRRVCIDKQLSGNDLPDAWLSAAVAHLGEHLVSFDRDFRKLLSRSQFTLLAPAQRWWAAQALTISAPREAQEPQPTRRRCGSHRRMRRLVAAPAGGQRRTTSPFSDHRMPSTSLRVAGSTSLVSSAAIASSTTATNSCSLTFMPLCVAIMSLPV